MFEITLKIGDDVYKGTGETVLSALQAIKPPVKIFNKSILSVTDGNKTHSRPLTVVKTRQLFFPIAQAVISKHLSLFLK